MTNHVSCIDKHLRFNKKLEQIDRLKQDVGTLRRTEKSLKTVKLPKTQPETEEIDAID